MSGLLLFLLVVMCIAGAVILVLWISYLRIPWTWERSRVLIATAPYRTFRRRLRCSVRRLLAHRARALAQGRDTAAVDGDLARLGQAYRAAAAWTNAHRQYRQGLPEFHPFWYFKNRYQSGAAVPSPTFGAAPTEDPVRLMDSSDAVRAWLDRRVARLTSLRPWWGTYFLATLVSGTRAFRHLVGGVFSGAARTLAAASPTGPPPGVSVAEQAARDAQQAAAAQEQAVTQLTRNWADACAVALRSYVDSLKQAAASPGSHLDLDTLRPILRRVDEAIRDVRRASSADDRSAAMVSLATRRRMVADYAESLSQQYPSLRTSWAHLSTTLSSEPVLPDAAWSTRRVRGE